MKNFFLILFTAIVALLTGCNKDPYANYAKDIEGDWNASSVTYVLLKDGVQTSDAEGFVRAMAATMPDQIPEDEIQEEIEMFKMILNTEQKIPGGQVLSFKGGKVTATTLIDEMPKAVVDGGDTNVTEGTYTLNGDKLTLTIGGETHTVTITELNSKQMAWQLDIKDAMAVEGDMAEISAIASQTDYEFVIVMKFLKK